jgi:hypothetical protein
MESQSILLHSYKRRIHRCLPIDRHVRISLIQLTGTVKKSLLPKQEPRMESQSISIYCVEMQSYRCASVEDHFQTSLNRVTYSERNSLGPEQQ